MTPLETWAVIALACAIGWLVWRAIDTVVAYVWDRIAEDIR